MGTSAAIYTRISSDPTGKAAGVQRQAADCEALAATIGHAIYDTYTDNDISAFSGRTRPAFERLMADARAGRFDVIVVWATDRLYRRLTELERIVDTLNGTGVKVLAVKSGDVDLATADGRAMARILGAMAQRESEKLGERVSARARQRAVEEGRSTTGRRPFGWNLDGTPDPIEAPIVAEVFAMALSGKSLSGIARELTARGITSSEGGPVTQARVSSWLRSPRHAGIVTYKGQEVGETTAIVDRATYDRVQALLSDPNRRPKKGRPNSTLLGGLLTCGVCGAPLKPSSNSNGRGKGRILTYACEPHRHVNRSREALELFATVALAKRLEGQRAAILAATPSDSDSSHGAEIAGLEAQLDSLADLLAAGTLHAADYAKATARVRARLEALKVAAAQAVGLEVSRSLLAGSEDTETAVRGLDRDQYRRLFAELVETMVVQPGGQEVDVRWRVA